MAPEPRTTAAPVAALLLAAGLLASCSSSTTRATPSSPTRAGFSAVGVGPASTPAPTSASTAASPAQTPVASSSSAAVVAPTSAASAVHSRGAAASRPVWASGRGAPAFPDPRRADGRSVDAVALGSATAVASSDTTVDNSDQHTAIRASQSGWMTPTYGAAQLQGANLPPSEPALWSTYTNHRAYLVVTGQISGDDHPADTAAIAVRQVVLRIQPVGRDGWRGTKTTEVAAVVLHKINNVWRLDNDEPS